jgi:hypothetical protein
MSKRFRVCSLDQEFLLPPSLQDWLPEDHLARFIADVVNELDLSAIYVVSVHFLAKDSPRIRPMACVILRRRPEAAVSSLRPLLVSR